MKFTSLSAALFLLASEASKVWAEIFEAVPGPVTTVKIDLGCPVGFSGTMRGVAFTIKPIDGSGAKVSSNPPGLVTADYDSVNTKLSLNYTSVAESADHSSAGVTIEVPQTQLEEVSVGQEVTATVLQGFGSQFKEAVAEDQANLFLTVDSPTNFEISAESQATINAKVTGTPSTLEVEASGSRSVSIQGAITKAETKDQATLSILSGSSFPTHAVVADDQSSVEVDPSVSGGCSGAPFWSPEADCSVLQVAKFLLLEKQREKVPRNATLKPNPTSVNQSKSRSILIRVLSLAKGKKVVEGKQGGGGRG